MNYANNTKEQGWLKAGDRRALSRGAQIMTPTQLQPSVHIYDLNQTLTQHQRVKDVSL